MGAGVSGGTASSRSASVSKQEEVASPERSGSAKWKIMPSSDEARYLEMSN